MKNRAFYQTLLLFLLAIYSGLLLLSAAGLRDIAGQAREQCLNEQYLFSSALYNDMAALRDRGADPALELQNLMQPYLYLANSRGNTLVLYRDGEPLRVAGTRDCPDLPPSANPGEDRTVSLGREGDGYLCAAWGALPSPFDGYQLLYRMDVTPRIHAWTLRNRSMLLGGGGISLLLALLLLLLLGRLFEPLSQITRLSRRIAGGDYSVRLPEKGRDEIAQMARSFNHMAKETENKVRELRAAAESRQRFVEDFAHELRTPLTAVYGYAEYLQKAALSPEDSRFALDCILSESRRMQAMAGRLMELANLRQGEIRMEPLAPGNLLETAARSVKPKFALKNLTLRVSCGLETLHGDAVLLQSLLENLLDNAAKASEPGADISLSAFLREGRPVIAVTDAGKGMDPQELGRITEPYYRVDKARSRREGGAGLGLAVCMRICALHGAELTFESAPGRGTTAAVTFTAC